MKRLKPTLPRVAFGAVLALSLAGCSDDTMTTAQFLPSTTASVPGLVKLASRFTSGSRVFIDVLIFGPEPDLDLSAFRFGVAIGDPGVLRFVSQATYTQTVLAAGDGQSVNFDVDGTSDPSVVQVEIVKQGGGAGNGFATGTAIVIELAFDVQGEGRSSLTLVGLDGAPPRAFDSRRDPVDAVTFDSESAGVAVVTTGGNGY